MIESDQNFLPKAYDNERFLHSAHARSLRILSEYLEPQSRLRLQKVRGTIVFFGSARSVGSDEIEARAAQIREEFSARGDYNSEQIDQHIARYRRLSHYYDEAEKLAEKLAKYYSRLPDPRDRHAICSGAGPGMMEAANRGAHNAGAKTIGLSISLPHEQGVNRFLDPAYTFEFHYFFMRKYWFVYLARALVVFPGGFGTFDELFEVLTLIQTQKIRRKLPIVLFGSEFWNSVVNIENLIEWGVISPDDVKLYKVCDTVDDAFKYLVSQIEVSKTQDSEEP